MSIVEQLAQCPDNSFNLIYADPPWKYSQTVKSGVLKRKNGTFIYPSMSMKELCALGGDIQRVSKDDAALLLWATMPLLPEAFRLIDAWGFKYKTCFVNWVKTTKKGDRPAFGVGYYTRSNAELCLLAVRGKIASYKRLVDGEAPREPNSMSSIVHEDDPHVRVNFLTLLEDSPVPVVMTPRREHSRKPEIVRGMITRLFGDIPRVELFARQSTPGWTVLGNDTQHFEDVGAQKDLAERKYKRARKISI
jgi:site-specific DNA-methyltransferase (adenine-specific)